MAVAMDDPPMGRYLLKKTRSPNIYLLIYLCISSHWCCHVLLKEREREREFYGLYMHDNHSYNRTCTIVLNFSLQAIYHETISFSQLPPSPPCVKLFALSI
jgi:hypothetical protein